MASNIYKFFVLLLLYTSCVTHENQLQSNAEISIRTTLQEVNADSGLAILMDSAGNVIAKSSLSLLNGKPLEDKVYTTVKDNLFTYGDTEFLSFHCRIRSFYLLSKDNERDTTDLWNGN